MITKKEIIVLANSIQPYGRCIAGIDAKTGEWIRPIMKTRHSIPEERFIVKVKLLDIVEIPFDGKPNPPQEFQIENEYVDNLNWKTTGTTTVANIRKYINNTKQIFYSDTDCVSTEVLKKMPSHKWKSLQLIETDVKFTKDSYKQTQWRANFYDSNKNILKLKVTDLVVTKQLNIGTVLNGNCLLTLSLAQPWGPAGSTLVKHCYKLVAGVIKL